MKILLHICCANCAFYPLSRLRALGHEVRGVFFNPNIHPFQEFLRRKEAVERFSEKMNLPVILMDEYPLEEFLRRVAFRESRRCWICYQWRMETAARVARKGKYDAMTTTLLFSKHQRHDWVREVAGEEAAAVGTRFHYEDFRVGWAEGTGSSLECGLYRQTYCGCIFSERDRYEPTGKPRKRP